jgi:DNA-binding response OmpR family regulator
MMPRWDGERFVRALRAAPDFPHVPVLVLSARADDALRENLLEHLVQDYLTKPFSAQELRARARNLVAVKRTVDILQKELNSQASDIGELTAGLVESRKSLQRSCTPCRCPTAAGWASTRTPRWASRWPTGTAAS